MCNDAQQYQSKLIVMMLSSINQIIMYNADYIMYNAD